MARDIVGEFKVVAEICIKQEDHFEARYIFPSMSKYKDDELQIAFYDESNKKRTMTYLLNLRELKKSWLIQI